MNTEKIAIAVYNPQPGTNAVMVRREMAQMPAVKESLTSNEMLIFKSTATRPIREYGDVELITKCRETFEFVAGDVGYNKPDELAWGKIIVRLATFLKQYYSDYTADDVLMAFELLVVGGLDKYLPKDSYGNPDKKHYQQFNIEYLSKVLNAYSRERVRVISKAQQVLPKPEYRITQEEQRQNQNRLCSDIIHTVLLYKYTGRFDCGSPVREMLMYDMFAKLGFVEEMAVSLAEKMLLIDTLADYTLRRKAINEYVIKRRDVLKRAMNRMFAEEIQITDYIKVC